MLIDGLNKQGEKWKAGQQRHTLTTGYSIDGQAIQNTN